MNKRLSESNLSDTFRNNDKILLYTFNTGKFILDQGFGEYDKQIIVRYVSAHNNMVFCKILFDENNMSDLLYKAFLCSNFELDELIRNNAYHHPIYDEYIYLMAKGKTINTTNDDNKDFYNTIKEYINDAYFNKHRQLVVRNVFSIKFKTMDLTKVTPQNILTI